MTTIDSGKNDRRSLGDNSSEMIDGFGSSFYRINHNGAQFEKIPHNLNAADDSATDVQSPYKDEVSLEIEAVSSSQVYKRKYLNPRPRKSTTSMKKNRTKKVMNPQSSQQQLVIESNGVESFPKPPIDAIFPPPSNYFNQSILHNFRPFTNGYPKNSVFNPQLDNRENAQYQPHTRKNTNNQSQQQSNSPNKKQNTRLGTSGVQTSGQASQSKKDILSCLEISRIDSHRKQESGAAALINKLPGQNPGGILYQNTGAPRTFPFRPMSSSTKGARVVKTVNRFHNQIQSEEYNEQPPTSILTKLTNINAPNAQSFSQIISGGTTTTTVNPLLAASNTTNTSRYEAYTQFQEFKERFIADQQQTAKSKDISSPKGNFYIKNHHGIDEDQSKYLKNLLQYSISDKEMKQQEIKGTSSQCTCQKTTCVCIDTNPTNLMIQNLLRSRQESTINSNNHQTQYTHILPKPQELRHNAQVNAKGGNFIHSKTGSNNYQMYQPSNNTSVKLGEGEYAQQILNIIKNQPELISRAMRNGTANQASSSMNHVIGGRGSALGKKSRQDKTQSRQSSQIDDPDKIHNQLIQIVQLEARRSSLDRNVKISQLNAGIDPLQLIQIQHQLQYQQKTPSSNRSYSKNENSKQMFMSYYDRKKHTEEQQQKHISAIGADPLVQKQPNQKHLRKSQNLKKVMNEQGIQHLQQADQMNVFENVRSSIVKQAKAAGIKGGMIMTSQQFAVKFSTPDKKLFNPPQTKDQIQIQGFQASTQETTRQQPTQLIVSSYSRQSMMQSELSHQQSRKRTHIPLTNHYLQSGCLQNNPSKSSTIIHNSAFNDSTSQIENGFMDETQYEEGMDIVELASGESILKECKMPTMYQPVLSRHRTTKQSSFSQAKPVPANAQQQSKNGVSSYSQLSKKTKNYQLQQMTSEKPSPLKIKKATKNFLENPHKNHKINQVINYANEFLQETFLRTNDQPVNIDKVKQICHNYFGIKLPRNFLAEPNVVKNKDFQVQAKERILQKLYEVINTENQMPPEWVQQSLTINMKKFYVGKGNNYPLVRSILKQRWWWQLCQEGEDFNQCQFIWTSWRKNELLDFLKPINGDSSLHDGKLRIYNRLEDNFHLSNKKALFFNMTQYYKALGEDPFHVLPLTFHIENGLNDPEFHEFKCLFVQIEQEKKVKTKELELKKRQFVHEKRKKEGYGSESDGNLSVEDEDEYLADINDIEDHFQVKVPKNVWIMKPGENSNRGNGIFVCNTLKEIIAEINSPDKAEHTHIIQRYIERPLLIHNRKFDIRVYGMLTSVNGIHKGYFYEDGYIRTSSTEFDIEDLSNRFIHLTNDAVQKNCEDYGKFENGNKVSYQNFQKYIDTHLPQDKRIVFHKEILPQIRKIIADTFKATFMKIDPKRRLQSFEIFGYDFMIAEDYKIYLIEANTNPCLELSCPLLARIIPAMLDSAFRICLDPLFPPKPDSKKNVNTLPELLPVNKFELVFDERIEGSQLREILKDQQAFNLKINENEECGDGQDDEDGKEPVVQVQVSEDKI